MPIAVGAYVRFLKGGRMLYPGAVLMPDDVHKLSRVCAIIFKEKGVEPSSGRARDLAADILRLFMNGLTEEQELLRTIRHKQAHSSFS